MSKSDAHLAIMKHLATMPDAPNVVWEDDDGSTSQALPRIVLSSAGGAQRLVTIDGVTAADPEVLAMVETSKGDFGRTARTIVNQIYARFTPGTRFDGVTIRDAPDERPALSDDSLFRLPVYIRGFTSF